MPTIPGFMTTQIIEEARLRYSRDLARHTRSQWNLARLDAERRANERQLVDESSTGPNGRIPNMGSDEAPSPTMKQTVA
ncbi:hypothetical protein FRB99_001273 [Tulasnella sp. 403]|nr:hypothetical protein FRB99_001273 [Tulasnella sp. 403]